MAVMDRTGDTKIIWNSDNQDEVDNARRSFNDLKEKGYLAFHVKDGGDKGKAITKFDPDAERLILTPPISGG